TDQAGQPGGAAPAGEDAELHLGKPQLGVRPVGGDAKGGGEGDFETASQAANRRCPTREPASASSGSVTRAISSTSAPAMNPAGLPESRIRQPTSCRPASSCSTVSSSCRAVRVKTLSFLSGESNVSVASRSAPTSRWKLDAMVAYPPCLSASVYSRSMISPYFSLITRRLTFWVGVSSPVSRVNSLGSSSQATIFSKWARPALTSFTSCSM